MSPRCLIDDFMEFSVKFSNVLKESIRNVSMIYSKSNQHLTRCVTIFVLYNPKGLRTVSYLGAKLWNDNLALFVDTIDGDCCSFKSSLKNIDDMTTKAIDFPYV